MARTAPDEGHEVRVFIAGDGVQLARPATASMTHGIGTGPAPWADSTLTC